MPTHPKEARPEHHALACLLTPIGEGGISVIEISGPAAPGILDDLFRNPRRRHAAQMKAGDLLYGKLWQSGELLDEIVLACVESVPHPIFEVNCHGGAAAAERVLDALERGGARQADWRELLAERQHVGRLDTIAREAAERIPLAATQLAAGMLIEQYRGALARALQEIRDGLSAEPDWAETQRRLEKLLTTAEFGRGLTEPPRVVIAGRPNVGKSTLANALLRFERVIVHPAPGTTRDAIEDTVAIHGVPFLLVDTAGIRKARDQIEEEGVAMGLDQLGQADLALVLFDGSRPLQQDDHRLLNVPLPPRTIFVINKCDLPQALAPEQLAEKVGRQPLVISARAGDGLGELEERMLATAYPEIPEKGQAIIFTRRQEQHLRDAAEAAGKQDASNVLRGLDSLQYEQAGQAGRRG